MHEFGVAQQIMHVALDQAARNNAAHITQFKIEMSDTADESADSLHFHLENLARGTIAEGAQFEIARVPEQMHCPQCAREFPPSDFGKPCPHCHTTRIVPIPRDEFRLVSIDIA